MTPAPIPMPPLPSGRPLGLPPQEHPLADPPPSGSRPLLRHLPPEARLLVAACRAGQADLRAGCCWEDGELLALCDAAGLRRCAAARLGAFVCFLLREAAAQPPCLAPPGCAGLSAPEMVLAAAVSGPPPAERAARRIIAGWWPMRRRIQGIALLALAVQDLAAWANRAA